MSLFGDMIAKRSAPPDERVWRALADGTRRAMLEALSVRPLLTGELVNRFPQLCRTSVMKHLAVLVEDNLVIIRREGRRRWKP